MNSRDDQQADVAHRPANPSPSLQALHAERASTPASFVTNCVPHARLSVFTEETNDADDIVRVAQLMAAGWLGGPGAWCTRFESSQRDHITLVVTGDDADVLARQLAAQAAALNPRWQVHCHLWADPDAAIGVAPIRAAKA